MINNLITTLRNNVIIVIFPEHFFLTPGEYKISVVQSFYFLILVSKDKSNLSCSLYMYTRRDKNLHTK